MMMNKLQVLQEKEVMEKLNKLLTGNKKCFMPLNPLQGRINIL